MGLWARRVGQGCTALFVGRRAVEEKLGLHASKKVPMKYQAFPGRAAASEYAQCADGSRKEEALHLHISLKRGRPTRVSVAITRGDMRWAASR